MKVWEEVVEGREKVPEGTILRVFHARDGWFLCVVGTYLLCKTRSLETAKSILTDYAFYD